MEGYQVLAKRAWQAIKDHYPEYLTESESEDTLMNKVGYYGAVLSAVREDPLPNDRAQNILEGKLSKKMEDLKDELREAIRERITSTAAQN